MPIRRCTTLLLLLAGLGLITGCGSGRAAVSGAVTVDDEPLKKGLIVFAPADNQGDPVTVLIEDGHYDARLLPGKKRVQITAPIAAGKRKEHNGPNAPWVEITKESLPPRYNVNTELSCEVTSGSQTVNWPLSRKAAKATPVHR